MSPLTNPDLPLSLLDILPNPVLVKGSDLRYIWVNKAFEDLFAIKREDLLGKLDTDAFPDRQAAQCNGGDKRVLASGDIDEAHETVFKNGVFPRVTITRKSRLTMGDAHYLIGVMHDITDVTESNRALEIHKQKLQEQSVKLEELAYTDPLTGIMNRRRLDELATDILSSACNHGCILLCDLDHFKKINDHWGHEAGDSALNHFVTLVKSRLREGDLVARIGGEEFACLLTDADEQKGLAIAEDIRIKLERTPLRFGKENIQMTTCIGVVQFKGSHKLCLEDLLSSADRRLYKAKKSGRNRTVSGD